MKKLFGYIMLFFLVSYGIKIYKEQQQQQAKEQAAKEAEDAERNAQMAALMKQFQNM